MIAYLLSIVKFDRSVKLYIFAMSMVGFAYIGIYSVLYNLFILKLGFDINFLGMLTASGQITWALCAFPAGMVGARFGLRRTLITGYLIVALATALNYSVPLMPHNTWGMVLFLSNIAIWIGAALITVNGTPYLMTIAPESDRNTAFTIQVATSSLAAFLGSMSAGFLPTLLMQQFGSRLDEVSAYSIVLWLGVPLYILSALLLSKARSAPLVIQEDKKTAQGREIIPVGVLVLLGILFGLQIGSEMSLSLFMNVYLARELLVSTGLIGTIFAVGRLLPFFISPLQPLALNRWGPGLTLAFGSLLLVGCAVLLAFVPIWAVAAVGFIAFGILTSFTNTARNLFGQETVKPRWRTMANAVLTISMAAGGGIVGFTGGSLIDSIGFRGLFLCGAVLGSMAVLLYFIWQRKPMRGPAPVQPEINT